MVADLETAPVAGGTIGSHKTVYFRIVGANNYYTTYTVKVTGYTATKLPMNEIVY